MAVTTTYKVTMFFGDGRYGWSETYYTQNVSTSKITTPTISPLLVLPQAVQLASARAAMLAIGPPACTLAGQGGTTSPQLEYIRISTVGSLRVTAFYDPQSGEIVNGVGLPSSVTTNRLTNSTILQNVAADNPYSCILMDCTLGNGLVSKRPLSGVPDMDVCDQSWFSSSGWYQLWKNFANLLVTGGVWGTISNSPFSNPGQINPSWQPIDSITNGPDGRPIITYELPIVFPLDSSGCPDFKVVIKCFRPMPGHTERLNGIYRISEPDDIILGTPPNTKPAYSIQLYRVMKPLYPFNMGYIASYQGGVFTPFLTATLTRTISRKRGRPFGLQRGRSLVIQ